MDRSSAASKRFEAAGESKVAQRNDTSKYAYVIPIAAPIAIDAEYKPWGGRVPEYTIDYTRIEQLPERPQIFPL